ncbi:MAG: histidinol-phosphate transaminase [Rikenellaceae bacterium]
MINGHGNNIYQYTKEAIEADFSSNIAFNNNSQRVLAHISQNLSQVNNYPDPNCSALRSKVATMCGVKGENVLITNGSAEAFYITAHLLSVVGATQTLITTPSFSEYEDSCALYGHDLHFLPLKDLTSTQLDNYTSVWLCAPNNPDGFRVSNEQIEELVRSYPRCYFILDRAYNDLSMDYAKERLTIYDNLITINSFTKSYGIPGLRLGYIVACEEIIERLCAIRPPWSVNSLSLLAGEYIVDHREELHPNIGELIAESHYLQTEIAQIDGFKVTPSTCNFFLVEIEGTKSAAELQTYLIENHKILIRNASNFRGLTERHFRVAALQRIQNNKLIKALKQWRSI